MANKKTNYLKAAIRFPLIFALSLCIVLTALLFVWKFWIYSGNSADRYFAEADYASMLDDVVFAAENRTIPTGLDLKVLDGIFTQENVKKDASGYFSAAFGGPAYDADTSLIEQNLAQQVQTFLDEHAVDQADTSATAVEEYVKDISGGYVNYLNLAPIRIIASRSHTLHKLTRLGLLGLGAVCLFLVLLIALLRQEFFASLSYAFGGAGLMLGAAPAALLIFRPYAEMQIDPIFLKNFLVQLISDFLQHCVQIAGICVAIMFALILLSVLFGRRKSQ